MGDRRAAPSPWPALAGALLALLALPLHAQVGQYLRADAVSAVMHIALVRRKRQSRIREVVIVHAFDHVFRIVRRGQNYNHAGAFIGNAAHRMTERPR